MATLSPNGNYVKLEVNVWYDKKNKSVHITSNDGDLPGTKLHMSAKKGTQSDANLREMLDNFGCGPKAAEQKPSLEEKIAVISGSLDVLAQMVKGGGDDVVVAQALKNLQVEVDGLGI
jgi:hypothetical protein